MISIACAVLHVGFLPTAATAARVAEGEERQVRFLKVASFKVDQLPVLAICFSGEMLMALTKRGRVRALSVITRKLAREFKCADGPIRVGAFSHDGKWVACADKNQLVRVYESASGKEVATIRGHGGEIRQMTFSPNGKLLAIACEGCCNMEGDARIWEVGSGKLFRRLIGDAFSVVFLGSNRLVAVGGRNSVTIWDVNEGKAMQKLQVGLKVNSICFSDKRGLLMVGTAGGVRSFALSRRGVKPLIEVKQTNSLSCTPDGSLLAVGAYGGVTIVDTVKWKAILQLAEHSDSSTSVAFSHDGTLLATADASGVVVLWKVVEQKR